MEPVFVKGEGWSVGLQLQQLQQIGNALGQSGLAMGAQLLIDGLPNLCLVDHSSLYGVELILHADHGVTGEKEGAKLCLLDFPVDHPFRGIVPVALRTLTGWVEWCGSVHHRTSWVIFVPHRNIIDHTRVLVKNKNKKSLKNSS
jgi:hypothetical protein